jgi:hypothetical protein
MIKLKYIDDFLENGDSKIEDLIKYKDCNERLHVNGDVKHLTNIIYNKIYQLLPNLILKSCRKMLSISVNFHTNESDRNLIDSKVMDRDIKINLILDRKILNEE